MAQLLFLFLLPLSVIGQTLTLDFQVERIFLNSYEKPLQTNERVTLIFEGIGVDITDGRLPRLTERIGIITEHDWFALEFESLLLEHPLYKDEQSEQRYEVRLTVEQDGFCLQIMPLKPYLRELTYGINLIMI